VELKKNIFWQYLLYKNGYFHTQIGNVFLLYHYFIVLIFEFPLRILLSTPRNLVFTSEQQLNRVAITSKSFRTQKLTTNGSIIFLPGETRIIP